MPDLVVVVPSRGRPQAATELVEAFTSTCTADTVIEFALDASDRTHSQYPTHNGFAQWSGTMVSALNATAAMVIESRLDYEAPFAIGFMGDDHRPRTHGWDAAYLEALRESRSGIVYGDDLLQGPNLPTQCAMTSDIVRALGYMAPPTLRHMFVDNTWRMLGEQAGCLRYLPDVVVEHLHPIAGKAEWDDNYRRVNAPEMYGRDGDAFQDYLQAGFAADVAKIRALR